MTSVTIVIIISNNADVERKWEKRQQQQQQSAFFHLLPVVPAAFHPGLQQHLSFATTPTKPVNTVEDDR